MSETILQWCLHWAAAFRVFHCTTWAKARAMQHWIDRSGIAGRPMPTLRKDWAMAQATGLGAPGPVCG